MRREWKARIGLTILAMVLASLPRGDKASPPGRSQAGQPSPVTPTGSGAEKPDSTLVSEADQILKQMSGITGLPIKSAVRYRVVSRAQAHQYMLRNLHSQYTPGQFGIQEAMLKAFGLVPPDFNLQKFLISFYTEQAAGFYDPETKTMYIARWISQSMQPMVMAHELTHALQDQNFGLEKFLYAERQNDDASSARQALVEGYATAAMLQRMIEPAQLGNFFSLRALFGPLLAQQIEQFPVFSKAPFFFRYGALFPYVQGAGFAQDALHQGGWKKLNSAFGAPPEATKDFFDPQLYFQHDELPKVELPHPKALEHAKGLSLLEENTLGALGIYTLVGQFISQEEARRVSTGWLGDRYLLYENSQTGGYAIVARTLWAESSLASEFLDDEVAILKKKYPHLQTNGSSAKGVFGGVTSKGDVMALLRGNQVFWAEGVPPRQRGAMLKFLRSL